MLLVVRRKRQWAPSSSNDSSDDLLEDYKESVTKVIGMLEEMKQQMGRLPDMSKAEHVTLDIQLSSINISLESIKNELHFIRQRMLPPQVLSAGVVFAPVDPRGPMWTDGENPNKKRGFTSLLRLGLGWIVSGSSGSNRDFVN